MRDSELLRPGTLLFIELTKTKTFLCLIQALKSMSGKSVMITYSKSEFHMSSARRSLQTNPSVSPEQSKLHQEDLDSDG